MPLYEYQCEKCAHRFEVIQKFSDAPIDVCPKCGGPVVKLLSSPAIQFKGSGWYITDYSQKGKSGSSDSEGKSSSSDTKSATGDAATTSKTDTTTSTTKPAASD